MDNGPPGQSRWKIAALVVFALLIATFPFTLVGMAFWAADGPWEFTGGGLRHWVFVKGSNVDRLSVVASTGRSRDAQQQNLP